jgi:hypothetical protein
MSKTNAKVVTMKQDPSLQDEIEKNLAVGNEKAAKTKEVLTKKAELKKDPPATSTKNTGVSELVRKMIAPKEGSTVAGALFSDVNKAVQEQFGRKLHQSEFQRNFDKMKNEGILTEKAPRVFFKDKPPVKDKVKDGEAEKETHKKKATPTAAKDAKLTDKEVEKEKKKGAKAEHKKLAKKTEEIIASGDKVTD